jgi:release factor glutamine methyltransferase
MVMQGQEKPGSCAPNVSPAELNKTLPRLAYVQAKRCLENAGCPDAAYDAGILLESIAGHNWRFSETPLDAEAAQKLAQLCAQRAARVPLQYLTGEWGFLNFTLKVGPGVLCPRADTEIVAEAAADALKQQGFFAPDVLDLCAGSGALGLGVKSFLPKSRVVCVEKSKEALPYLKANAAALVPLGIPAPAVEAVEGDLFCYAETLAPESLDAVLCNPPYLTDAEMQKLQPEVAHEPAMALDGGADGLVFYRALAEHYRKPLKPKGLLAVEIGWQQKAPVTALLEAAGWQEVRCIQDLSGNDRCILARRPE